VRHDVSFHVFIGQTSVVLLACLLLDGTGNQVVVGIVATHALKKNVFTAVGVAGSLRESLAHFDGVVLVHDFQTVCHLSFLLNILSLEYINDLLKVFKTFFRYCTEEEYIKSNPAKRVHNVRQPKVMIRTFSEDEILKMLNHYQGNDFISVRNKAMLALFFDTGLRLTEVLELRNDQIYDGFVRVMGKGRKERVVPCSPYLAKLLIKHRIMKEAYFEMKNLTPQNYVFVSYRGKKMTQESVSKFMKRTAKIVGVREDIRVSPHTCRHTFAHLQLKNGLDIYSLSRLMGHEHITVTQKYLEGIRNDEVLDAARETGVLCNL